MAKYNANNPINVWVGNLGKYNEGELVGEWFGLPCFDFEEEWGELMQRIGIGGRYEEVFCADWECSIPGLKYSEYPDYEELDRIAAEWDDMPDYEQAAVQVRMTLMGESFDEAVSNSGDVSIYYGCSDMTAVAYEYIDSTGMLDQAPDYLRNYFDYEAYGRDMAIEGCFDYSEELGCMVEAW